MNIEEENHRNEYFFKMFIKFRILKEKKNEERTLKREDNKKRKKSKAIY